MKLISRKLRRDLWAIRGRVLTMMLILASGVSVAFGVPLALTNILSTQQEIFDRLAFADLEIRMLPEDTSNLPSFDGLPSVESVERRLVMPGLIRLREGNDLSALAVIQDDPESKINRLSLLEGRSFRPGTHEAVIDKALADYHGYKVGDPLELRIGRKHQTHTVVGIALSPEFLVTSSNPDYVIAEPGSLGVIWAGSGDLKDVLGFSMINSILFKWKEGVNEDLATQEVMKSLGSRSIESATSRDESYSYKSVRMDVEAFRVYSPAIIVTLVLLSFAMGLITFRRFLIERQRDFGILAAMGVRRSAIARALLTTGLQIGVVGGLIGLAVGWALGWVFAEVYAKAMHLPVVIHDFDTVGAILSLGLGALAGAGTLLVAALPTFRSRVGDLMRSPTRLAKAPKWRLAGLPLPLRLSLRNLMREKVLTVSSIVAMGASVAVAISYGLAMTSTFRTVEGSFQDEHWDYAVDFQYPLYLDEIGTLSAQGSLQGIQPYYRTAADMRRDDRHVIGVLVGLALGGELKTLNPVVGRTVQAEGEAVVSIDLARELGVGIGETMQVVKGDLRETVTVVGTTNDIFLKQVTLVLPQVQRLAQAEEKFSGAFARSDKGWSDAAARRTDLVARVTDKQRLIDHFRNEIEDMMGMVYITIGFSVAVSVLFVTALVYLGIAEKRDEYSVLRSLGMSRRRLTVQILSGVAIQVALALALAVPCALILVTWLNGRMGEAWFAVNLHMSVRDFFWPLVAALLVAPVAARFGTRAVMSLDIPQYLKGRVS